MAEGYVLKSGLEGCLIELDYEDKDAEHRDLIDSALRAMPVTISNSDTYRRDPNPHKLIKLKVQQF